MSANGSLTRRWFAWRQKLERARDIATETIEKGKIIGP